MTAQALCLKKKVEENRERGPSFLTVTEAPFPSRSLMKPVWFWDFVNVSETCQSPWFIMACCCLRCPGAYIERVPERGDRQYVRTYVLKSMFTYLKWTCVSRQFTDTFSTLLTAIAAEQSNHKMRVRLKKEPSRWCRLVSLWSTNGKVKTLN